MVERYGDDTNMVELRLELAEGCPKIAGGKIMDLCGVYYPDRIGGQKKARRASRREVTGEMPSL